MVTHILPGGLPLRPEPFTTSRGRTLKQELVAATRNGVPVAAAARAAGISRSTAINWPAKADSDDA
ncbi:Protein of unknown function [Propionibacterium freudenreichii]|nr:Protein of unknown function [Propionibacterium freudenreichii]CEH04031.1 Protein of unknown function [Propionibacterium freudenreichii]CEH04250.1 Protein of unknown function [Propionibacterium freudenreichii]CEH09651.1 Protein of unknown function [Propionibacterium freudenreichii]CEI22935.1 Protein of unknown function [Propionibacterium freudenreichii]